MVADSWEFELVYMSIKSECGPRSTDEPWPSEICQVDDRQTARANTPRLTDGGIVTLKVPSWTTMGRARKGSSFAPS